jgi:hypothetical protein
MKIRSFTSWRLAFRLCIVPLAFGATLATTNQVEAAVKEPDIVYVNPCAAGCAISRGNDDALDHKSSVIAGSYTFAAFAYSSDVLNNAVACARATLAPFNIHVVMTDPGVARREVILTTDSTGIGIANLPEIAPWTGQPEANTIAFVFGNTWQGNVDGICWSIATVVGNLYGLDQVDNCSDVMAYSLCGEKSFTDSNSVCDGQTWGTPGYCYNGNATQDSFQVLQTISGTRDFIFTNSYEGFEVPHAGPSP